MASADSDLHARLLSQGAMESSGDEYCTVTYPVYEQDEPYLEGPLALTRAKTDTTHRCSPPLRGCYRGGPHLRGPSEIPSEWLRDPRRHGFGFGGGDMVPDSFCSPVSRTRSSSSCSSSYSPHWGIGGSAWSLDERELYLRRVAAREASWDRAMSAEEASWWAPLAEDTIRLADDVAGTGLLPRKLSKAALPTSMWRLFCRYKYVLLFVVLVTLVNGLFSLLLIECLVGNPRLCFFGGCHSPSFDKRTGTPSVYDRSTMNASTSRVVPSIRTGPIIETPKFTEDDDEAFLEELSQEWSLTPHATVPRTYFLSKQHGLFRGFLVQDLCYLFMPGAGPGHQGPTGIWFDGDALEAVIQADHRSMLDAREFEKLEPLELLVPPPEGEDGEEAAKKVHKGAFGFATDLGKVQKRLNRSVGSFVGPKGIMDYLSSSSASAMMELKGGSGNPNFAFLGLVGGVESTVSSFAPYAVFLSEMATGPPSSSNYWSSPLVFFPGDKRVASQWTAGAMKAALGRQAQPMAGQRPGQPICFRNAIFTVNERPATPVEVDNFRQKSWGLADSALEHFQKSGLSVPSRLLNPVKLPKVGKVPKEATLVAQVQKVVDSAGADIRVQLSLGDDVMRSALFLNRQAGLTSRYQITVLVDSIANGKPQSSKLANLDALTRLIHKMYPKLAVEALSVLEASFLEQVATLKRTVMLVTPHGAATGMAALLPRGASMVEIFPYMFRSDASLVLTAAAQLEYQKWENEQLSNSKYEDDCMAKGNYLSLSAAECRRNRHCLFCVRDHVSTIVDKKQFHAVLLKAQKSVRSFLQDNVPQGWKTF